MKQEDKTAVLQKWMLDNLEDWYTICGMGRHPITEEEFMRLWHVLQDNGFYESTLVLLTCHYYAVQERLAKNIDYLAHFLDDAINGEEKATERLN